MVVWVPALFAVAVGLVAVGLGAGWRRRAPRIDDRAAGDGLAARALRDGAAAGFGLVGLGCLLLAVGYLGTIGSFVGPAGGDGLLTALAVAAPLYDVGAVVLVGGFAVLVGAMVLPAAVELWES